MPPFHSWLTETRHVLRVGFAALLTVATTQATFAADWPPPDTMAQRMKACEVCHGQEGRASAEGFNPRIAGKPAGYLYNQLQNFRDGKRSNVTMTYLLDQMSEAYLLEIAGYFAGLDLPYPAPQTRNASEKVLARGEKLVREGDAARDIPPCSQCHGDAMMGVAPAMPGLLGLPRDYILAQLGAWRSGQRRAAEPDCMAEIAQRLPIEDVSAMATWLSAQPVRGAVAPREALPGKLPIACGSGTK